jgi:hypothetical protein
MMSLDRPSDTSQQQCRHCGAHVSSRFAAVHGDEDDVAHRCPACDCFRRLSRGSAAGLNVGLPDPIEQPNRNRGQRVEAAARTDGGEFDGD